MDFVKAHRQRNVLLGIILIVLLFTGCSILGEDRKTNQNMNESLEEMEATLLVFYDSSAYHLLNSFTSAHPEIKIKKVCIYDFENDGQVFESSIKKYGQPDLILGGMGPCTVSVVNDLYDLASCYEKGYIADLSGFCNADTTLDTTAYFPETFEVFKDEDRMYALPLGITMSFMVTTGSKYNDSAFTKLKEGYLGRELLDVLEEELEKEREKDEFFCSDSVDFIRLLYQLGGVTQTDEGVEIDEKLFKQVYEFVYTQDKEMSEVRTVWAEKGKTFNSDNGFAEHSAFEPRAYEGKFTVSFWGWMDAPAIALSYAATANHYHLDEGTKAIYIPNIDNGNTYKARVQVYGAIGAESNRKQLAYDLLRRLMDEKISSFSTPGSSPPQGTYGGTDNLYPVNKENAISLLDCFEKQTAVLLYGETEPGRYSQLLERADISAEEKEKHEKMLNGVSGLYFWSKSVAEAYDIFDKYYYGNIRDYKGCYEEIVLVLNSDSDG